MKRVALIVALVAGCVGTIEDPGNPGDDDDDDTGDPCEGIPAGGACDGDVLTACIDGAPVLTDCAATGLQCGALDGAHTCATACELAGLADGDVLCDGDTGIVQCDGGAVVADACPTDTRCFDGGAGPECLTADDACAGIGPQGHCAGDTLTRCDDLWPATTDCTSTGAVCGYESDELGYQCLPPEIAGAYAVTGRVEYEERPLSPGSLGPATPAPARGVTVYLIRDADDATLATATAADDGTYTLRYDAGEGESVHVLAATRSDAPWRPIRVRRTSGNSHGLPSDSFAAAPHTEVDLLASEDNSLARPFHVFENIVAGLDYTRRWGATQIAPINVNYQRGSGGGSYYNGSSNTINLAGGSDDDGYDDIVILHEFGHYHQDEYGDSDSPGGSHPNPGGDDPRLAWGEGQASYIAIAITGMPHYIDYSSGGGWSVDLEDGIHDASMSSGMSQYIYEWMVAQLMWDVGDDGMDLDADPVSGNHRDAMTVTTEYFHSAEYVGRGRSGVDLVDWLDGYLWQMGTAPCESLRALVHDWYEFPYDFSGPVACE